MNKMIRIDLERYNVPLFQEKRGKDWIYYGEDNLYPLHLIDFLNQSAVHNAIVTGKVNYIVGRGLTVSDETLKEDIKAEIQDILDNPNPNETYNDIARKITTDYEIYNGFALEIIKNPKGDIVEVYHADFSRYRISKDDDNILLYSEEWDNPRNTGERRQYNSRPEYTEVPRFDPAVNVPKAIYYYVHYRPDLKWYPLPDYVGAIAQIETSVEIANFDLNAVKHGFSGGNLIALNNGMPASDEQRDEIVADIKSEYAGSTNAGQLLVTFSEDETHSPKVLSLMGNDLPERYSQLEERVNNCIFIGHKVTSPMLFGVKTEGQLGGRNELLESYELFKETYIVNRQRVILNCLNDIFEYMGLPRVLAFDELQPMANELEIPEAVVQELVQPDQWKEMLSRKYGLKFEERNTEEIQMSDDYVNHYFATVGEDAENYEILKEYPVNVVNGEVEFQLQGLEDGVLTDEEYEFARVAKIIQDNPDVSADAISTALGIELGIIQLIIASMDVRGMLKRDGATLTILSAGKKLTKLLPENMPEVKIMYRYGLRPDALPAQSSRPFCNHMMGMGKLFSRKEIEGLRNDMTKSFIPDINDVWKYRGGWYRPPGTDVSVPFCRHIWQQVVVTRR